jgi:hypothetical protein
VNKCYFNVSRILVSGLALVFILTEFEASAIKNNDSGKYMDSLDSAACLIEPTGSEALNSNGKPCPDACCTKHASSVGLNDLTVPIEIATNGSQNAVVPEKNLHEDPKAL